MYIKLLTSDAIKTVILITKEIADLPNLNLEIGVDIKKYLSWEDIEKYTYIRVGLFDLRNKNRLYPASKEELDMWDKIIKSNKWKTVESKPVKEAL